MNKQCKIKYPHDFDSDPCELCRPEYRGRAERKKMFISRAISINHTDTEDIIQQASDKFDKENPVS